MKLIRASKTTPQQAEWAVDRLRSIYGKRDLVNAETWTAATLKVFMEYPFVMVEALLDPVTGIASQLTFFPGVPDVSKRLKEMKDKTDKLNLDALAHTPRKIEAPEPDPRAGTTEEQRRATVLRALGRLPPDKVDSPTNPHFSVKEESPRFSI